MDLEILMANEMEEVAALLRCLNGKKGDAVQFILGARIEVLGCVRDEDSIRIGRIQICSETCEYQFYPEVNKR